MIIGMTGLSFTVTPLRSIRSSTRWWPMAVYGLRSEAKYSSTICRAFCPEVSMAFGSGTQTAPVPKPSADRRASSNRIRSVPQNHSPSK